MDYASPSGDKELNPECVAIVFEFLHVILEMQIGTLESLYGRMINITLKWIQADIVCSKAIAILRTIAVNTNKSNNKILEPISAAIPIFSVAMDGNLESAEHVKRFGAIMQLFDVLIKTEQFRIKILEHINEKMIQKIFRLLFENNINCYLTEDTINMYIYALIFIDNVANYNDKWTSLEGELLQQK